MKLLRFLILLVLTIGFTACSDDDKEVSPKEEEPEVSFSFLNKEKIVEVPAALANANDPYASVAVAYLNSANTMANYFSYFNFPEGAKYSKERITPGNGRVKSGNYWVYTWSDPQLGSAAYQIGDHGSHYTFEVLVKEPGMSDWLLILSGEEKKDQSSGFMKIYNTYSDNPSQVIANYTWSRLGDVFKFVYFFQQDTNYSTSIEISLNEKTGVGSLEFFEDTNLSLAMAWDALGNGTWVEYNSGGEIIDEGGWTK